MSGWGTQDMAAALPDVGAPAALIEAPTVAEGPTPQEHGWVTPQSYDYATYGKSNKELSDAKAAFESAAADYQAGGIHQDWAGNAVVYEWKDEFGDVGPRFPDIESQLFGDDNHVKSGIKFSEIQKINVTQEGSVRIKPVNRFEDAGLHPVLLETVKLCNYSVPTPIQQYCLPAIFKGHDVVACAQTGSGKTAAFLIPILSKLMGKAKKLAAQRPNPATHDINRDGVIRAEPLVLIVCPNRELATQIFDEARRFCYRTMFRPAVVYGGGPLAEQIMQLGKGADILIGTPGRLCDFIRRPHLLSLHRLKYMVIDEADELLATDWEQEMKPIMSGGDQEEGNITYMLFSATFPKAARDLAKEHLKHDHVRIRVGRAGSSHINIKQDIIFVEPSMKRTALMELLMSLPPERTIIFVNSKRTADEVDDFLFNKGMPCTSIHSDRTQREREDSIRAFKLGKTPILIATGVTSRGIDIANIGHVINFDLPSSQYGGIEEYTHRIGRTGRIGNQGLATSFYNDRDSDIAETLVKTLLETRQKVPDFLEQHIPEGFDNDGNGDVTKLHFDADSEDEAEGGDSGDAAGGWGVGAPVDSNTAPAAIEWGTSNESTLVIPATGGWSAPTEAAPAQNVAPSGWAAPLAPVAQIMVAPPAPVTTSGWGAPAAPDPVTQVSAPVAAGGWGAPVATAPTMQAPALVKPVATQGWNATPDVQSGGGWGAAASNDPWSSNTGDTSGRGGW